MKCFTIGVHGTTLESFFGTLVKHRVTHFCDIRMRRGMRGAAYKYANATELQHRLAKLGIEYRHVLDLAPSKEVRELQVKEDKRQHVSISERTQLSPEFARAYKTERLAHFDLENFIASFPKDANVVLFCVESHAAACHRSLVADAIAQLTGRDVPDLTPFARIGT